MPKSTLDLDALRFWVAAAGILSGICISFLVNSLIWFLMDHYRIPEDFPGILLYGIMIASPLVILTAVLWMAAFTYLEKGDSRRKNAFLANLIAYFGIPFLGLYFAFCLVYWMMKVS